MITTIIGFELFLVSEVAVSAAKAILRRKKKEAMPPAWLHSQWIQLQPI
jgi:hypothetical protein